jgi:hypothetical protein
MANEQLTPPLPPRSQVPSVSQLPLQGAPVEPEDADVITPAKKAPGPTGKATPEQAFVTKP